MQYLNDILDSFQGPTKTLLQQARVYRTLETRIQTLFQLDIKVMRLFKKKLVLQVPNAALATRLRYRSSEFLGRLHQEGLVLSATQLVVNVRPNSMSETKIKHLPIKISEDNRALLVAHAEALQPSALREAFLNLSERSG